MEREEREAKGFVPNLERLLLAVDDSANGKFAPRLAGMIAGSKGMPTTVVQLQKTSGKAPAKPETKAEETPKEEVKAAAKPKSKDDDAATKPVDVTTKTPVADKPPEESIAEEANKGYDIMVVGLEKTVTRGREIHADVNRVAASFNGPLAIVDARNGHLEDPLNSSLSILAPVNGTNTARNAAEIAFVIAHASKAPVTILFVAARTLEAGKKRRRGIHARRHEQAILKDITGLAESYGVKWRTTIIADVAADEAILKETERSKHNLVVMGASRRPGDLFFGETTASVMEKSKASLMIVSSGAAL